MVGVERVRVVHALAQAHVLRVVRAGEVDGFDVGLGEQHVAESEADAERLACLGIAEDADVLVLAVAGVEVEAPVREPGDLRRGRRGETRGEDEEEERANHRKRDRKEAGRHRAMGRR